MNKELPEKLKIKAQKTSEGSMQEPEGEWGDLRQVTMSKRRDKDSKAKIHLEQNFTGEVQQEKILQAHTEQKKAQREFWFAFEWGWGPGDKEH